LIKVPEGYFVGKKAGTLAPKLCSACACFACIVAATLSGEETHTLPAQLPIFSCERKTDRLVTLAGGILKTMLKWGMVVRAKRNKSGEASSRGVVGQGHSREDRVIRSKGRS